MTWRRALDSVVGRDAAEARTTLVVLLLASALIHLAVTPSHLQEYRLFGVFFLVSAVAQAALAVACVRRASPAVVGLAVGLSVVIALVWLLSRTVGVPLGPEAWQPEHVGLADAVSTVYEIGAAVGGVVLARRAEPSAATRLGWTARMGSWGMFVGWMTVGAIFVGH